MNIFVIIVTFNGIKWIEKCLNNLLYSTSPISIIVIDNGSTDGTQELIATRFIYVDFIQNKENIGFGRASNIGIKKGYDAGATYIFLLNQDAWVESNTLELLIKTQLANPMYGIISPIHLNGTGSALDAGFSSYVSPWSCPDFLSDSYLNKLRQDIYEVKFVNAAAWLMSRECIECVGGFNPLFFLYGEDDNYIERLHYHGFRIGVLPSARIYHDREGRNVDAFIEKAAVEKKQRIMHYCNPNINPDIFNDIRKCRRAYIKHLVLLRFKEMKKTKKVIKKLSKDSVKLFNALQVIKTKGLSFLSD